MLDIKKHSLLGIISLILAIIVIIFGTIEFILMLILKPIITFNNLFFISLFLTLITTFFGVITIVVKKDNLGWKAIKIGILFFILNWIILFFVLSKLRF